MTLVVTNSDYTKGFMNFLVHIIKQQLKLELYSLTLRKFETVAKNDVQLKELFKTIDIRKVLQIAIKNMHCRKILQGWEIYIDNAVVYPKTAYRIVTLCKLINYGTLSVKGSNIFTNVFKRVSANLTKYFDMYYQEVN